MSAREIFSFAEVAAEIGSGIGDLQRAVEERKIDVTPDPVRGRVGRRAIPTTGLRAVPLADVPRVFKDVGIEVRALSPGVFAEVLANPGDMALLSVAELPGFPGLARFDDLELMTKQYIRYDDSGARPELFEERLERLKVPITIVRGLTADGRERALSDLQYLAAEKPPEAGGKAVAQFRMDRAAQRDAAGMTRQKPAPKTRAKAKSEARADG